MVALPLAVLASYRSTVWVGTAFPGFLLMENAVVASVAGYDWPPDKARLFHAQVVSVDGEPVRTSGDVYGRVRDRPPGTRFRYTLRKAGTVFETEIPSRTFSLGDWVQVYGVLLLIGLLCLGTAITVVFLQPATRPARVYFWTTFIGGLFATLAVFLHQAGFPVLTRLYFLAEAFFPAAFIHLALVFPVDRLRVPGRRLWPVVPYTLGAALAFAKLRGFFSDPPDLFALHANYVIIAAGFVFFLASAVSAYHEDRDPLVRPRLRVVLLGIVAGSVLSFTAFVDNALGGGRIPMQLGVVLVPLFFLAVAYAIVQHDLFDVDRLVRQGFIYGTLSAIVVSTYAGVLLLPAAFVPNLAPRIHVPLGMAFVLVLALALDPLRRVVQDLVDHTFYRSRLNYRSAIENLSEVLAKVLELPEVVTHATRVIADALQLEAAAICLFVAPEQRLVVWARDAEGRLIRSEGDAELAAFARRLGSNEEDAGLGGVVHVADPRLDPMARAVLERARATLGLPLCIHERTIGMLLLGARRSGKSFGADDVELLHTLAQQTAMALHNARSYEEMAALTRDLDMRVRQRTDELHASNERLSDAYTELQRTQAKLVHSEKMSSLGQLVAGVAHELNNPASFVYGSLANLADYVDTFVEVIRLYEQAAMADPEMRERLQDIRTASRLDYLLHEAPGLLRICTEGSERIKRIVDDLRTFARAGGSHRVPTDVREGIESTLGLLQHRLSAGGISVVRDYQDIPTIEAAPGELNQAWMNLLSNAVDALDSRAHPEIHIAVRRTPRTASFGTGEEFALIEVEIRDNGAGIDPAHLTRVFEPFFTTKPIGRGTGLGLSITYGAVKSHGGDVTLSSVVGGGTSVRVRLPAKGRAPA